MKEIEILRALWAYEKPNYTEKEIRDAIEKAIKALEAQRWIPVTERLPDDYTKVLITNEYGIVTCVNWNTWYQNEYKDAKKEYKAIAWMPLPNSYTKEETT